jgi:hypothetical protein
MKKNEQLKISKVYSFVWLNKEGRRSDWTGLDGGQKKVVRTSDLNVCVIKKKERHFENTEK